MLIFEKWKKNQTAQQTACNIMKFNIKKFNTMIIIMH